MSRNRRSGRQRSENSDVSNKLLNLVRVEVSFRGRVGMRVKVSVRVRVRVGVRLRVRVWAGSSTVTEDKGCKATPPRLEESAATPASSGGALLRLCAAATTSAVSCA